MPSDGIKANLSIRQIPDVVLRTPALPVPENHEMKNLLLGMSQVMKELGGVGIAAPQVGVTLRVFIMSFEGFSLSVINPSVRDLQGLSLESEGCLSIPGTFYKVPRAQSLKLSGFNHLWDPFEVNLSGFLARIAQHEMDHLDGVTIDDRSGEVDE